MRRSATTGSTRSRLSIDGIERAPPSSSWSPIRVTIDTWPRGCPPVAVDVDGRTVKISNPDKVFFSARGETKLDLVWYYFAVGTRRPAGRARATHGAQALPRRRRRAFFYQKRVPASRPPWLETVTVTFPSGRSAEELCPVDVAHILWAVNLGCLDLNPWPVRRGDTEHPDELRVDLDPQPGVPFDAVRRVALEARAVLEEHSLVGFPKTSGSRGIHINVPIEPRWSFTEVRRAALALARELERRLPDIATSAWWKEQRGERVFVDYNQNARDRTVASAYSVRANPEARVSCPLEWDEVPDVDPGDLTIATVPGPLRHPGGPGGRHRRGPSRSRASPRAFLSRRGRGTR